MIHIVSDSSVVEGIKWMKRLVAVAMGCGVALTSGAGQAHAASPQELFVKHCAPCHSKDGKAQTPAARKLGVKDLSEGKAADDEIVKQVTEGKKDELGVQKMPPFKEKMTPEEIKSMVAVVKSFRK